MARLPKNLSRADEVRLRRKIAPARRKPIPNTTQHIARNMASAAHVITRRPSYSSLTETASQVEKRHRVYVPTGIPGAEIQLPALPGLRIGWRVFSALIAIAAAAMLYYVLDTNLFAVQNLKVSGSQRLGEEEIYQAVDYRGYSMLEVEPQVVSEHLRVYYPELKDVQVSLELPDTLHVYLEERTPTLSWMINDQPAFWIDREGFPFPVRGEDQEAYPVYASGDIPKALGWVDPATISADQPEKIAAARREPMVDKAFITAVLGLKDVIPSNTRLVYEPERGLGWTDPEHGWQVYLGTQPAQIAEKLNIYNHAVQALLDKNLQPSLISLEFLHAPYYRLEQ
jgi:cell division protein FtsQ